jgi:hypothetical protein
MEKQRCWTMKAGRISVRFSGHWVGEAASSIFEFNLRRLRPAVL